MAGRAWPCLCCAGGALCWLCAEHAGAGGRLGCWHGRQGMALPALCWGVLSAGSVQSMGVPGQPEVLAWAAGHGPAATVQGGALCWLCAEHAGAGGRLRCWHGRQGMALPLLCRGCSLLAWCRAWGCSLLTLCRGWGAGGQLRCWPAQPLHKGLPGHPTTQWRRGHAPPVQLPASDVQGGPLC